MKGPDTMHHRVTTPPPYTPTPGTRAMDPAFAIYTLAASAERVLQRVVYDMNEEHRAHLQDAVRSARAHAHELCQADPHGPQEVPR